MADPVVWTPDSQIPPPPGWTPPDTTGLPKYAETGHPVADAVSAKAFDMARARQEALTVAKEAALSTPLGAGVSAAATLPEKIKEIASGPLQFLKGQIPTLAGAAATLIPGAGVAERPFVGPLARMVSGGVGAGLGAAATGQNPLQAGGAFMAGQAPVEALGGGIRLAAGPTKWNPAAKEAGASKLADYLKSKVPSLASFPTSAEGLRDMLLSVKGKRAVSEAYDTSLMDSLTQAEGKIIPIREEDARLLKIPYAPGQGLGEGEVNVFATDAIKKTVGKWAKAATRGAYNAITNSLADNGLVDEAMHAAYKQWSGLRSFLGKGSFTLTRGGYKFDPTSALKGLTTEKGMSPLSMRDMADAEELLRSVLQPIAPSGASKTIGEVSGAAAGTAAHHPYMGVMLGRSIGQKMGGGYVPPSFLQALKYGSAVGGAYGEEELGP